MQSEFPRFPSAEATATPLAAQDSLAKNFVEVVDFHQGRQHVITPAPPSLIQFATFAQAGSRNVIQKFLTISTQLASLPQ